MYAPAERSDTLPLFLLYPYIYLTLWITPKIPFLIYRRHRPCTSVIDTCEKLISCVNDTGEQFIAVVTDTDYAVEVRVRKSQNYEIRLSGTQEEMIREKKPVLKTLSF